MSLDTSVPRRSFAGLHGQLDWRTITAKYAKPDHRKAILQLADTFVPYAILVYLMVYTVSHGYSYWFTFALGICAAPLFTRIFIIFHDCVHGAFLASPRLNGVLGYVCGILSFTPFRDWQRNHLGHHATSSDLDRRGIGDVWTLTVAEYLTAPRLRRLAYRLYRNPVIMFIVGPPYVFLLNNRLPSKGAGRRQIVSVILTNIGMVCVAALAALTIGFWTYLQVHLTIFLIAGPFGVWLFYVQHNFEGTYWERHENWDSIKAALVGASYYKLPKILHWMTGNIGFHHVHHIRARIPNYNLQQCYAEIPALQEKKPLTLRSSLGCMKLALWDEEQRKLVSFRSLNVH